MAAIRLIVLIILIIIMVTTTGLALQRRLAALSAGKAMAINHPQDPVLQVVDLWVLLVAG